MFDKLRLIGITLLITIIIGAVYNYETTIKRLTENVSSLNMTVQRLEGNLVVANVNITTYKAVIEDMNSETKRLSNQYTAAMAKYTAEKSKPSKVRYEVLYKYIDKKDSNECKDIKYSIDGISNYINNGL